MVGVMRVNLALGVWATVLWLEGFLEVLLGVLSSVLKLCRLKQSSPGHGPMGFGSCTEHC